MCSDGYQPEEEVAGECEECGCDVDLLGYSVEHQCHWSPEVCKTCHDSPCDQSC